jgi:hypothetical protein
MEFTRIYSQNIKMEEPKTRRETKKDPKKTPTTGQNSKNQHVNIIKT